MNDLPLLDSQYPLASLEELGFEGEGLKLLQSKMSRPVGLVMVAGASGSLHEMTINACAAHAIKSSAMKVSIVPPEGLPSPIKEQEGLGARLPFKREMVLELRKDPDLMILAEPRSEAAFDHLVSCVQTGVKVLSRTHASGSLDILRRMMNFGVSLEDLKNIHFLSALVYQASFSALCPKCSLNHAQVKRSGKREGLSRIEYLVDPGILNLLRYRNSEGCNDCTNGAVGRTIAAEVSCPDAYLVDLVAQGSLVQAVEYFREKGGRSIMEVAVSKAFRGLIDLQEVEHKIDLMLHRIVPSGSDVAIKFEDPPEYIVDGASATPVVR